jgi:hypothetical protein
LERVAQTRRCHGPPRGRESGRKQPICGKGSAGVTIGLGLAQVFFRQLCEGAFRAEQLHLPVR